MNDTKCLNLDVIDNGGLKSFIADDGRLFATGSNSREMLREAGFAAKRHEYTHIVIGSQSWEVARLVNLE